MAKTTGEKPKRAEFSIPMSEDDRDWHETRARQAGLTVAQYVRDLLLKERQRVESAPAPEPPKKLSLRESYLREIAENGTPLLAAKKLGVTPAKLKEWGANPTFLKEVAVAKASFLEGLERDMVLIGQGRMKGDTQALGWLLNAHHPAHGRAKKELILSMLNPLIKKLVEFLATEFGPDSTDPLKRALASFQIELRKKMAVLT